MLFHVLNVHFFTECDKCRELKQAQFQETRIILEKDPMDDSGNNRSRSRSQRNVQLQDFLRAINALLNSRGGGVIIHFKFPYKVALFDEKVDDKLLQLIVDDTFFHENFERYFIDENHVIFRVITRKRRKYSTLNFQSKISFDKGLDFPTQAQMERWMKYVSNDDTSVDDQQSRQSGSITFVKDSVVREVIVDSRSHVFLENSKLQAKSIPANCDISEYCWEKVKEYISAFSKIRSGGSVFFGLKEERTDEKRTGKLICEGISLEPSQRQQLINYLRSNITKEMLWLAQNSPLNPVDVKFHPVNGGTDNLCVIEIAIKYFHGVSFFMKDGPEAWVHKGTKRPLERIPFNEWVKNNIQGHDLATSSENIAITSVQCLFQT